MKYIFISVPINPMAMASVYVHIWCIDLRECLISMGRLVCKHTIHPMDPNGLG